MPIRPLSTQPIRLVVHSALSIASGDVNEDGYALLEDQLWVIDGASGLTDRTFTSGPTDAAWLTSTTLTLLSDLPPRDLRTTLGQLVADISTKLEELGVTPECAPHELPSASLAAIRVTGMGLEVLTLGDCRLILRGAHDHHIHVTRSTELDSLDRAAVQQLMAVKRSTGLDLYASRAHILDLLRHNRDLMNRPGGYHAFSTDLNTNSINSEVIKVDEGAVGLLVSDGLYRLVDTFHRYEPSELIEAAERTGLKGLLAELRAIETSDPDAQQYPRLKMSDDATGVLFSITRNG